MNKNYSFRIEYRYNGGRIVRSDFDYNNFSEVKELVNDTLSNFDELKSKPMTADIIMVDKVNKTEKTYLYYNFQTGKTANYF